MNPIGIAALIQVVISLGVVVFQLALVAGAPWGAFAMGGQNKGILPSSLRIGAAVSAVIMLAQAGHYLAQAGVIPKLLDPTGNNVVNWIWFPALEVTAAATPPNTANLFINATSVGMTQGDESLLPAGFFPSDTIAADVIISETLTPFLEAAAATGARTHDGTHMLQGQIRLIADYLGIDASPAITVQNS